MWINIDENCANRWNFLYCIWCVDGKNTEIKFPARSGSKFYDYKQFFSVLLHAAIDSKCRLSTVDIGAVGCQMDAEVPNLFLVQVIGKNRTDYSTGIRAAWYHFKSAILIARRRRISTVSLFDDALPRKKLRRQETRF
jgi:hypothetical protein